MTPKLLREMIAAVEFYVETLRDSVHDCRAVGSDDGIIANLKDLRANLSLLRRARRALLTLEGT